MMTPEFLHRCTSLGRILDPRLPTHLVLFVLMIAVGVARAFGAELSEEGPRAMVLAGIFSSFSTLGTWALARELLVDDEATAFVSVALGASWLFWGPSDPSVLLLFATLLQVRLVNRTVGLQAKITDALSVVFLSVLVVFVTDSPLLWLSGLLAFSLDARLQPRAHRSWFFSALCLSGGLYFNMTHFPLMKDLGFLTLPPWAIAIPFVATLFSITILLTRNITARADATQEPLRLARIRSGMFVALVAAILPLYSGAWGLRLSGFLWTTLSAAAVGTSLKALRRTVSRVV